MGMVAGLTDFHPKIKTTPPPTVISTFSQAAATPWMRGCVGMVPALTSWRLLCPMLWTSTRCTTAPLHSLRVILVWMRNTLMWIGMIPSACPVSGTAYNRTGAGMCWHLNPLEVVMPKWLLRMLLEISRDWEVNAIRKLKARKKELGLTEDQAFEARRRIRTHFLKLRCNIYPRLGYL